MDPYLIAGTEASYIAKEYGTPVFIYDSQKIKEQYTVLSKAFKNIPHRIHYASKANEAEEILDLLKELGAGIDTVSPNEIRRALKVGFQPEDVIFTPSCPGLHELEMALEMGIRVHLGGLEYLKLLGSRLSGHEIGLRINPAVAIEGNQKISTAHANSKFGVPLDQLDELSILVEKYRFEIKTLHIHIGSDVKSWLDLAKAFDVLISVLHRIPTVDTLDIGGGLKIKYSDNDNRVDIDTYANYIREHLQNLDKPVKIILEPGKFLVAEAGYLLTRVNIVKKGYAKVFVGVNSGFHHLIRPMYYNAYHNIVNISNSQGPVQLYDVVGQLCEEDTFARDIPLPEVRRGDLLVFENAGAYAYAMSTIYNLREKPRELFINNGEIKLISDEKIHV